MQVCKTNHSLQRYIDNKRAKGNKIGFVPTMGYLHEGHVSLLRKSVKQCDVTILSIYVNPTQFGPNEDLDKYPRDFKRDYRLAKDAGVDVIFYPSNNEMYPDGYNTFVEVEGVTEGLCGKFRPGHFRGVATIVLKLINIVTPDVMYMGQKDLQQVMVVKRMVADLNMRCKVVMCPTVREADKLAMSSRNKYLSKEQRNQAPVLYRALSTARQKVLDGEKNTSRLKKIIKQLIIENSKSKIEYIEVGDLNTLKSVDKIQSTVYIALAVYFGKARLIDNIIVRIT